MKPASEQRSRRGILFIAFFTIFLDLLGFGIIIPIQSFYVKSFHVSEAVVTLLSAGYSLMQFIFAPLWGRLSDRVGRRPIILFSVFISAIGHLIFGLASSIFMVFAARLLAGFGNANLAAAQAVVADVTPPEDRAKGMGLIGVAFGLGFVIGPAVGGFLSSYGPAAPSIAAALLGFLNLILAFFILPETRETQNTEASPSHHRRFSLSAWQGFASQTNMQRIFVMSLVNTAAFSMMEMVIGFLLEKYFVVSVPGESQSSHIAAASKLTAYFLVTVGITAIIMQGGLIGRLAKKYGERPLVQLGVLLVGIAMFIMPLCAASGNFALMLFTAALLATGTGMFNPSSTALLSRSASKDSQGAALGLNQSMSAMGRVIGPTVSGALFGLYAGLPFYLAGILMGITFLVSLGLKPPPPAGSHS